MTDDRSAVADRTDLIEPFVKRRLTFQHGVADAGERDDPGWDASINFKQLTKRPRDLAILNPRDRQFRHALAVRCRCAGGLDIKKNEWDVFEIGMQWVGL